MPRKKKEDNTPSSRSADDSKSAKLAKKVSKAAPAAKKEKEAIKKPTARVSKLARVTSLFKKKKDAAEVESTPLAKSSSPAPKGFKHLPRHGETQLVAFVRDPQCVFTYWEVTPQRIEEVKRELQDEFHESHMVLRLFSVDANGERILVEEIRVEPGQINRYVELKQLGGGTFVLEIGQKTPSGRYFTYAQSNPLSTSVQVSESFEAVSHPLDASDEMPEEMVNYFYEQGYDVDSPAGTEFISSGERHKHGGNEKKLSRKKVPYRASFI